MTNPVHTVRATLASVLFLSAPASADVLTSEWTSSDEYAYEIWHMPDLDQERVGLPASDDGDPGDMYCVPTSTMNIIMYIANHGFPEINPGPGNWAAADNYDLATQSIELMGVLMGTDPNDGTDGAGSAAGLDAWLIRSGKFTYVLHYVSGPFKPSQELVTAHAVLGALVRYTFGRYDVQPIDGTLFGAQRASGHVVTLVKSEEGPGGRTMWARDPASPGSEPTTQSAFAYTQQDVDEVLVQIGGGDPLVMSRLNWANSGDGRMRLIDGVLAIYPVAGYSLTEDGLAVVAPFQLDGSLVNPVTYDQLDVGGVLDVILDPDQCGFLVLREGVGNQPVVLEHLSRLDSATTTLRTIANAVAMTTAWNRDAYVLTDETFGSFVHRIDLDGDAEIVDTTAVNVACAAAAYDSRTVELVAVSSRDRQLVYLNAADLQQTPEVYAIPPHVPLEEDACIDLDPRDGDAWVRSSASTSLYGLARNENGGLDVTELTHPTLTEPTGFAFDDRGHLFVVSDGRILEFAQPCAGCPWERVTPTAFDGLPAGAHFGLTRSSTNFDPDLHTGPGWVNTPLDELLVPDSIEDCFGDVDGNGLVGAVELLGMLAAWGTDDWQHDIAPDGGDGVVDLLDLLALLSAWGPCPEAPTG